MSASTLGIDSRLRCKLLFLLLTGQTMFFEAFQRLRTMSALSGIPRQGRFLAGLLLKDTPRCADVRLSSTAAVHSAAEPCQEASPNDSYVVNPNFINRNPRNLERLALAVKDRGWATVWPSHQFWHRLHYKRSQHHITAFVEHGPSGTVVISASTQEWPIKRHLYSTQDVAASENIGRVLAQRCLAAGIQHMTFTAIPWQYKCESIQRFRNAVKEGGVILSEPRRIFK
ncbi:39S ribosomal protein L18, mitochondrial [Polypterus senegalus]|uniref:39S ribosomal protein L18, mitochondrial n=1 Tax=Polypterus senegalus TaxID=55291 RepID=UPI001966BB9E|nr:39S ribosomal protein L18, mitochondrial [Polypterus senegalus]